MKTCLFAAAAVALALPSASEAQATVTLLDYRATVPAGWVTVPPTSSMRLAQYTIPGCGDAAWNVVLSALRRDG